MGVPVLEADRICKHYGNAFALQEISFVLERDKVTGLIGPNGSGKTTLLEIVAGLLSADSGNLRISGLDESVNRRRGSLFYLPDNLVPYPDVPVSKVCAFFCAMFSTPDLARDKVMEQLGIVSVLNKRAGELSKGFRKRLCLAISLWSPQPFLLLDEPFDGFDLRQTLSIIEVLKETASSGRALLLSIHQLSDAEKICERFLLLNQGRLVAQGGLSDLRAQSKLAQGTLEEVFLGLT